MLDKLILIYNNEYVIRIITVKN